MSNPIKVFIALAVTVLIITAAVQSCDSGSQKDFGQPQYVVSPRVKAWLKTRLARPTPPLPKPGQPRVILIWRESPDAPKVMSIVPLVDHPEGVKGVYGMDVTPSDADAKALGYQDLSRSVALPGAWLIVVNKLGHPIASTPQLTPDTVKQAFEIGRGAAKSFKTMR